MYKMDKDTFQPHPEGNAKGIIIEVMDKGEKEGAYGKYHSIAAKIESNKLMNDGRPFLAFKNFSLKSSSTCALTVFRNMLAGRTLSEDELLVFDEQKEFIGKKVGFTIQHDPTGQYANIINIWPLEEDMEPSQDPPDPYDDEPVTHPTTGPVVLDELPF